MRESNCLCETIVGAPLLKPEGSRVRCFGQHSPASTEHRSAYFPNLTLSVEVIWFASPCWRGDAEVRG